MKNFKEYIAGVGSVALVCGALVASPNAVRAQNPGPDIAEASRPIRLPEPPDLGACVNLDVAMHDRLIFRAYAEGVQIYRWDGSAWVFVAPEAVLYYDAEQKHVIGIHYAGPTWEGINGGKVVGRVVERCDGAAGAIPWLLLESARTEGAGLFSRVTFIQRVHTVGGLAPSAPGAAVGAVARVPYTAEYFYYTARR